MTFLHLDLDKLYNYCIIDHWACKWLLVLSCKFL